MPAVMGPTGDIVAFIDIGTYSVRLLIVRMNPNHSFTVLSEQKEPARLGSGEYFEQRLEQEAMRRASVICSKFGQMARTFGAGRVIAVATAATREARNQKQFLQLLRRDAQLDVRVISGKEEARLTYLGVSRGMHLEDRRALILDIGGGSTEVMVGDERDHQYLGSMALGAIRLSQMFQLDTPAGTISREQYDLAKHYVRNSAVRTVQAVTKLGFDTCVGSSGTIVNLSEIAVKTSENQAKTADQVLSLADLKRVTEHLCSLSLSGRQRVPGINPNRADIILGGAAVLETLMEDLGADQVQPSRRALRDGLLVDYMARCTPNELASELTTRHRSVLHLGRACGFDEPHAMTVARLAVELFDAVKGAGLFDYRLAERELLNYAGLLHDIGVFLSFVNHQAHTYYLIRHADLIGFDQSEIATIAALARYHRKGLPRKAHAEIADLDKKQRRLVAELCVLLKIAESLDRSHSGVVEGVRLREGDTGSWVLEILAGGDCTLEMWEVRKHTSAFKKVFNAGLIIEQISPVQGVGAVV